jgi:lipid A 3-O-deacylase
MRSFIGLGLVGLVIALPVAAQAQEIYAGTSFHGADTPFTLESGERGSDVQAGIRSAPIEGLEPIGSPSAYLHGQVSVNGNTSLVAAGLSWKFGDKFYVRPGIGLALHNDKIKELFEPEIALGAKLSDRTAFEVSWVHVSNATLLSGQNPGLDFIGARLVFALK